MGKNDIVSRPFKYFKDREMEDEEFKKEYDKLEDTYKAMSIIIKLRHEYGLTQQQLAEKIGTQKSAISRLENGNSNPSYKFLKKIAKAFNKKLVIDFK